MAGSWSNSWGLSWSNSWGTVSSGSAGTDIVNAGASTSEHNTNINHCDHTNFKQYANEPLLKDAYAGLVRKKSYDDIQPQDRIRSKIDKQPGSVAPEQADTFLAVNEVKAEDL